jgi:ribonuclease P protein component
MRLAHARQFAAVRSARTSRSAGPLLVFVRPNDLGYPRLGLAVARRVGTAVKRNRIKRLLREAFRHTQHDRRRGYDVVISVRPHESLNLNGYRAALAHALNELDREWRTRLDD